MIPMPPLKIVYIPMSTLKSTQLSKLETWSCLCLLLKVKTQLVTTHLQLCFLHTFAIGLSPHFSSHCMLSSAFIVILLTKSPATRLHPLRPQCLLLFDTLQFRSVCRCLMKWKLPVSWRVSYVKWCFVGAHGWKDVLLKQTPGEDVRKEYKYDPKTVGAWALVCFDLPC